ncbi:MAG: hypothetical protein JWO62_248 [Acidimicrobiaceae bacterium]|nr:hypothetical protein [Acidimicrobiaceae bacterium]
MARPWDKVLDLGGIAVLDNHCHAVEAVQGQRDAAAWRSYFTESSDPEMRATAAGTTAFYGRLIRRMAEYFETAPREADVLEARAELSATELVGRLFRDAAIGGVVVDEGYPEPADALASEQLTASAGCAHGRLLRLELAFQVEVAEHASLSELLDAVRDQLGDLRGDGYVGLKSIVAYRTGLAVERWGREDVESSFARAREEIQRCGAVRLGHKPLLDTLLHVAFEEAARQELPVQFHVGYGDPDVDLRRASPLELRGVLEETAYRAMPIVLLHGCWPYFREGAFLASLYGNAYLDLSYAIPFLSLGEMRAMTSAALGAAPISKLMYSSDGVRVPELHWMGALDGRLVLGSVLAEMVDDGELDAGQALDAGRRVLAGNAERLYGISTAEVMN